MRTLLRAIYEKTPLPKDINLYRQILETPNSIMFSSQLYYLLTIRDLIDQVPGFFHHEIKKRAITNLIFNSVIEAELRKILDRFEKNQIHVIPLKGPLFAEKYFGSLSARGTSDIDILVKRPQIKQAIALINDMGYDSQVAYEQEHFHIAFQKRLTGTNYPLIVEIHWHFLREKTSSLDMNLIWRDSVQLKPYQYVREPSDFHMFYLICLHGWNHELINWKYFVDIIQMIHTLSHKLSYEDLFLFAGKQKTYRRIARTLIIVYHEFPHLNHILPLPLRTNQTFWWHKSDLYSKKDLKATFGVLIKRIRQTNDYDTWQQKWIWLKRNLFPDPVIMARIIGPDKRKLYRPVQYFLFLLKCFAEIIRSLARKRI
ncbi:hypothetical protein EWI07_08545 [Sporolactobacillus sp. THM7-4]|nr:hypothetical protein EWI07_08545 [Sporolactobacillus sp. THM7-4]